jgi:hypothetical protein
MFLLVEKGIAREKNVFPGYALILPNSIKFNTDVIIL